MPSLNPRQFFHGTTQKFEPGDMLRPSTETGVLIHSPDYVAGDDEYDEDSVEQDASRVFSTNDERDAWAFATSARDASREPVRFQSSRGLQPGTSRPTKRPYVYEVEPAGNVRPRAQEGMPNTPWETLSDTARVVRRIDAPPPDAQLFDEQVTPRGVQPALPGDDPSFAHGFMSEFEADEHGFTREMVGVEDEFKPGRDDFVRKQAERSFRRDNQDLEREGASRFQPEMFNSDQFVDLGYLEDLRYRNHW